MCEILTHMEGQVCILEINGHVVKNGHRTTPLHQAITDHIAKGNINFLLALGEEAYLDSSGLGDIVDGFATACNRGGTLKAVCVKGSAAENLLEITTIAGWRAPKIEKFNDVSEALLSFNGLATIQPKAQAATA